MYLGGQARRANTAARDAGFALAALLVAIGVLSVMMLVALPTWRHNVQREKEAELVFRGEQYARAIGLYQRKLAGAFPPSLDALVEQKFLRKRYKDPITNDDFEPVFGNAQTALGAPDGPVPAPGNPPGRSGGPGGASFQTPMGAQPQAGRGQTAPPGARPVGPGGPGGPAGIVGVRSKSTARSIRLYNGRERYDQWVFLSAAQQPRPGSAGPPIPPPGRGGPGLPGPATGTPPPGRGRGF